MEKLLITQGSTFIQPVRWGTSPLVYSPITAITATAPLHITSATHGCPDGWQVAIVGVQGMTEINASEKFVAKDFHVATVVDVNTIELNEVDGSFYTPYVGGGYIRYNTPVDLTGFSARCTIRDKVGGAQLASMTSAVSGGIDIDIPNFVITLQLTATQTAAFTWVKGVFDLELEKDGIVTNIMSGTVAVTKEITS